MTSKHPTLAIAIALPLRRIALLAIVATLLALAPCSTALARQAGGPLSDIIDQPQMGPAELQAIKDFTSPRMRSLASPDAQVRSTARRELLSPFMGAKSPSVSFRIAYGDELMGVLRQQAGGRDKSSAVWSMQMAGELGTTQAEQLLAQGLGNADSAIRYAAASAYGQVFRAMAGGRAAIPQQQQGTVLQTVGDAMTAEENIFVVDAYLRAFNAARGDNTFRVNAMDTAMDALSEQLKRRRENGAENGLQSAQTALRGVAMAQELIIDLGAGIPREAALAAARLTGQSMAFAMAAINDAGGLDGVEGAAADTYFALLRASETTAALANTAVGANNTPAGQPIDRAIQQANVGALQGAVDAWIGANGVLTRAPHNNDAANFG
jgi:hypothetical protein